MLKVQKVTENTLLCTFESQASPSLLRSGPKRLNLAEEIVKRIRHSEVIATFADDFDHDHQVPTAERAGWCSLLVGLGIRRLILWTAIDGNERQGDEEVVVYKNRFPAH